MERKIRDRLNGLADEGEPFLFVVDYRGREAYISKLSDIDTNECLYDFNGVTNVAEPFNPLSVARQRWRVRPPLWEDYRRSFGLVKRNILEGNSYLANLTCRVAVDCDLSLEDMFMCARARYRLLLRRNAGETRGFVCFSPEIFVKTCGGRIYAYPMKGTMDASMENAREVLLADRKEAAEHATIVDLIRNDLSRIATDVRVDRYRYVDVVGTDKGDMLQTSSEISGKLPQAVQRRVGDLLEALLPAGSITGAPKDRTMEIIREAEGYERGFYTGVMGIYANGELDSAVMIRFVEEDDDGMYFKAGGGITCMSDCKKEYEEMLRKVCLPVK